MATFYFYLGVLAAMSLYSLYKGVRNKDLESFTVCGITCVMTLVGWLLVEFELYSLLILILLITGIIQLVVSDLGFIFMNPAPLKDVLKDFPSYVGILGIVSMISCAEIWVKYDQHWILFQLIFGLCMSIAFITAFYRIMQWGKIGNVISSTLLFALILLLTSKHGCYEINEYLNYWTVSVIIQSIILFAWRCGARNHFFAPRTATE
jgi:hypothetical protein